jgi:hypothetical protein
MAATSSVGEISPEPGKNAQNAGSRTEMRRHHEEIAMLPALSLLLPFAGALWLRIKTGRKK